MRYEANGPLVGRFLAVAIQDEKSQLAGIVLIFRTMEQKAFSKEDARTRRTAHASVVESHRAAGAIR